jgi:phage/plasmid-like protein (TIGR03299 family)
MSPEEMLKAAQIDWTVSKRPAYTTDSPDIWNLNDPTSEANFLRAPDNYFLVRDSDNKVLSPCGESYVPFQNSEVMNFFKKFTDAGHMTMETAGSLKDGKDIWGLAKLTDQFRLAGDDEVKGYLLLNNSHQVGKAMTIMFTPIRVVCNNTLTMALNTQGQRFRVLHLQMFDEEIQRAAEEALGLSGMQMKQFQEQSEFLSSKKAKKFDLDNFIAELFQPNLLIERAKAPNPDELPPLHEEFKRTAELVKEAVETSPGANMSSAKGTWWGALNAVTYVVDHQKKSQAEGNALHSAWFGSGANTKRKALTKAIEYAEVA